MKSFLEIQNAAPLEFKRVRPNIAMIPALSFRPILRVIVSNELTDILVSNALLNDRIACPKSTI
jgi:hypothetical protein